MGILAFLQISHFKVEQLDFERYVVLAIFVASCYLLFSKKTYISWRGSNLIELFGRVVTSWCIASTILVFWLVISKTSELYSRAWVFLWLMQTLFVLLFIRVVAYYVLRSFRKSGVNLRHIAILGDGKTAKELVGRVKDSAWTGYRIHSYIARPDRPGLQKLAKERLDEIWLATEYSSPMSIQEMLECLSHSTAIIRYSPDWLALRLINHGVSEVLGMQMIDLHSTPLSAFSLLLKNSFDYVLAFVALLFLSPLMVLIAIGIKLSSSGPIFYKQDRVGWNGSVFKIIKFRSMPEDVEIDKILWGSSNEKTQGRFFKLLRALNFDELPQLINVLKGEMSLVGPRPERPQFVDIFKEEIPDYMKKHLVKAGITGWAQIHGWRGDTDLQMRINYDLYYIEHWSIWLDFKIILLTVFRGLTAQKFS